MKTFSDACHGSFLLALATAASSLLGSKATLAARAFAVQTAPAVVMTSRVTFPATAEVASLQAGDVIAAATVAVATSTPYLRQIVSVAMDRLR